MKDRGCLKGKGPGQGKGIECKMVGYYKGEVMVKDTIYLMDRNLLERIRCWYRRKGKDGDINLKKF